MMKKSYSKQVFYALEQINLIHTEERVVEEDESGLGLATANSIAAMQRFQANQSDQGDIAMNIGFIPVSFFERGEFSALNIKMNSAPDAFLRSIMPLLRLTGNKEATEVGEIELVSLSDKFEAGLQNISDKEREGTIIVFKVAEGVVAFVSAVGSPGEMGNYRKIIFTIAASIEYAGSAEDLMTAFYRT
jgi:hypothetical protein